MLTYKQFKEEKQKEEKLPGTYLGVRPSPDIAQAIQEFSIKFNIPNFETSDKLHVTLLYSRKHLPDCIPNETLRFVTIPSKFVIWTDRTGKRILVLLLDSPALKSRHEDLMKQHQAEYDYPEYIPHLTLSYDIGDFDDSKLDFSLIARPFELGYEYHEDLNDI